MPTPAERKALFFVAAVVSLGAGVRAVRAVDRDAEADPASRAALREQLRRVDSARAAKGAGARRRGSAGKKSVRSATSAPVDLDTASAELIETLNGIGPALAERIVAQRDSFGPFGSIEGLRRVRGIGPALSAKLAPQVTFSRLARPHNAVGSPAPAARATARTRARRTSGFP